MPGVVSAAQRIEELLDLNRYGAGARHGVLLHGVSGTGKTTALLEAARRYTAQLPEVRALHASTLLMTCVLMFIGGGSAGTAGGIKVTTFAVLAAAILAEVRGEPTSSVLGRRLAPHVLRQALTVALLGIGLVIGSTLALLALTQESLEAVLFEVVSAFGTVGLSTGITPDLPAAGHLLLVGLMLVGRLGPITLVSALALRERTRRYELPEERPVIG